jgi:hypothetical protein
MMQKKSLQNSKEIFRSFFGTIISGCGKQGYNIQFIDLPVGNQEVYFIQRKMLKWAQANEEEAGFNHARDLAEAYANATPPITKNDPSRLPHMLLL